MATNGRMKNMGSWDEGKATGWEKGGKLKDQILEYLKDGKNKLLLLEHRISGGKKVKRLLDEVRRSKKTLQTARQNFDKFEKKAEQYIEKNPKKAFAMAVAAGVLAGSLWSAFNGKKTFPRKKRRPSSQTLPL
jgi:hypothetical protein